MSDDVKTLQDILNYVDLKTESYFREYKKILNELHDDNLTDIHNQPSPYVKYFNNVKKLNDHYLAIYKNLQQTRDLIEADLKKLNESI